MSRPQSRKAPIFPTAATLSHPTWPRVSLGVLRVAISLSPESLYRKDLQAISHLRAFRHLGSGQEDSLVIAPVPGQLYAEFDLLISQKTLFFPKFKHSFLFLFKSQPSLLSRRRAFPSISERISQVPRGLIYRGSMTSPRWACF